jgi:hypothetical protein
VQVKTKTKRSKKKNQRGGKASTMLCFPAPPKRKLRKLVAAPQGKTNRELAVAVDGTMDALPAPRIGIKRAVRRKVRKVVWMVRRAVGK